MSSSSSRVFRLAATFGGFVGSAAQPTAKGLGKNRAGPNGNGSDGLTPAFSERCRTGGRAHPALPLHVGTWLRTPGSRRPMGESPPRGRQGGAERPRGRTVRRPRTGARDPGRTTGCRGAAGPSGRAGCLTRRGRRARRRGRRVGRRAVPGWGRFPPLDSAPADCGGFATAAKPARLWSNSPESPADCVVIEFRRVRRRGRGPPRFSGGSSGTRFP